MRRGIRGEHMATVRETARGLRRPWEGSLRSALWRTGLRIGVMGLVAVILANINLPWRPATLCALRQFTGIPCPLCGTTTAAVHAGSLDIVGALAANPVTVVIIALLATSPLTGIGRWWETMSNRPRVLLCIALFAAAEVWQLFRYGLLP